MVEAAMLPQSAPSAVSDARILAQGHLHPAILLLRLLDALRQVAAPLLLGIVVERWFLALALILFVVQLGTAVARYLTLSYRLTADELSIREGLLHRQERRIPLDRIQDLGFESTLLRRALGLSVVLVETASGRGVEARLDALSHSSAEHLREILLAARQQRPAAANEQTANAEAVAEVGADDRSAGPAAAAPEWLVHRSTAGELLLRGATDLRLGAFVVSGFAALQLADQLKLLSSAVGVVDAIQDWLRALSPLLLGLVLLTLLLVVLAFGVVTSTLGNLVQFHGFTLRLCGEVLQRRYGLLTTRQKTLPRARVQRVTIEQSWLRRLCSLAVVKADSAGGSRSDGQDTTGGWDVVVPLTQIGQAHALLPALLPGIENDRYSWQKGSPRLVLRTTLVGLIWAAIAVPLLWWRFGPIGAVALSAVPLWAVLGVLVYRNLGWASGEHFFALQHGVIGRTFAAVPVAKVQAVVVRQSPLSQLLGLAELTVFVAGGSPTRLPDLTLADARRLAASLSQRAATAAAADW